MDDRIKALEEKIQLLTNKVSQLEFQVLELKQNAIKPVKKKTPGETSLGGLIWNAYEAAFLDKYRHKPVRNAKTNSQCADIAKRLGADGPRVVEFYLTLKDPQFLRLNHPIGLLQMSAESVHSMWKRGAMTTQGQARAIEKTASNMDASKSYLERKHGSNR